MRLCMLAATHAVLVLLLATCVRSKTVECGFGTCGPGLACDEVNRECVYPSQLVDCAGMPDASRCEIAGEPVGVCKGELCVRERCGDGLVTGAEVCDGSDSVPAAGTCVDFAFDYGVLGCTAICSEELDGCRRLGWAFRTLPVTGQIRALAEDGDQLYVVVSGDLYRFDGATWHEPPDGTQGVTIEDLWASGDRVIAIGVVGNYTSGTGAALHFDGTSWTRIETEHALRGMWARSAGDAYAVGDAGAIYHFDGNTWTAMSSPTSQRLNAVWGTDGMLAAVGFGTFLQNSGNGWSAVNTTVGELRDVWGASATEIYAVEHAGKIHRFEAGALTTVWDDPLVSLEAISGHSADEIYVVGNHGTILLWDGVTWSSMTSPASEYLEAVHAGAETIYAGGTTDQFLAYERVAWLNPMAGEPTGTIHGMWGMGRDHLVAVGTNCAVHEYDGASWATLLAPVECYSSCSTLFDVWGTSAVHAYAVGMNGALLERTPSGWTCGTSPLGTNDWLYAVWGTSPTDVFIGGGDVGADTAVLAHFNGTTWEDWSSRVPFLGAIRGIWGTGPSDVFLVAGNGRIAHYDGTTFTEMPSPPMSRGLHAAWGSGPGDVFAVGDDGTILHYDGVAWSEMLVPQALTVPTNTVLTAIVGSGPDNVFAAGGRTLLHYDGARWAPVARPTSGPSEALYLADDQLFVVGQGGIGPRLTGRLR